MQQPNITGYKPHMSFEVYMLFSMYDLTHCITKHILSYLGLQVIHQHCKVGGVVTETGSNPGASKGDHATITGPATGLIMPTQGTRKHRHTSSISSPECRN